MPPGIVIREVVQDFSTLRRDGDGAIATGSTWLQGNTCFYVVPRASDSPDYLHTVSFADQEHIRRHELRHCTGQQHDRLKIGDRYVIVWRP